MVAQQVFALIYDETVQNVCVGDNYEDINRVARCVYGDEAFAVDCMQYPCSIGDKYIDNVFYTYVYNDEGEKTEELKPIEYVDKKEIVDNDYDLSINRYKEIEYVPTQEQQVAILTNENNNMILLMADMIGGVQ